MKEGWCARGTPPCFQLTSNRPFMTPDSPPLVSIIIPLYNAEETIDSCLQSCLGQTYKNLEIIVIDDGSSDNSRAIVQGFDHAYPQIRTFRQNRGGVTEARNYGMRKATGQYLLNHLQILSCLWKGLCHFIYCEILLILLWHN